jgi:hypothetical protein
LSIPDGAVRLLDENRSSEEAMKYMMLIYSAEGAATEDQHADCVAKSTQLCHELASKGQFLGASPLHPVATATCVRIRNGSRLITDGPFAETTEQLGGYYQIDAPNLDEAIAIAARVPAAHWGTIEVRPVVELPGLPSSKSSLSSSKNGESHEICVSGIHR